MSQKKAKFNIVDIIVILILIAGVAFLGVKMFGGQEPAASADPAEGAPYLVSFRADCVPEDIAATLTVGSKAENASRNMDLGTVVDVVIGESVVYGYDSKGNCVASPKPGHVSVTLVCRVTGFQNPTGLQVGQFALNMGHAMGVCAGNTEISTVVCNIVPAATE